MENQRVHAVDEIEIDLAEVIRILFEKIPMMAAVGILTALLAFAVGKFCIMPTYTSTTKIYILNKQDNSNVTVSDIQIGTQLTKDYAELILGRSALEEVIEQLGLDMDYEMLRKKVSVNNPEDTRILYITVCDTDPVRTMKIANAVRDAASVYIKNVMDIEAVNVAEPAYMPSQKSGPDVKKMTLLGGLFGVLLVIVVTVICYLLNDTIKTSDDIEKYLGLSTLALIPVSEGEKKNKKSRKR